MSLDEDTLQGVALNGEMDFNKWPNIIEPLLERLNHIVYKDFSMPRPYPTIIQPAVPSSPDQPQSQVVDDLAQPTPTAATSQAPTTPVRNLPPVPPFPNSSATSTTHVPDSLPPSQRTPSDPLVELPAILLQLLQNITNTLRSAFSDKPPHTIQRLAELTLYPTKHYKTLPAWLRAVDRVVSVSTSADVFPLSDAPALPNGVNGDGIGGILWKTPTSENGQNGYDAEGLGSDESLGGALLTPIPWLKNGVIGNEEDIVPSSHELEDSLNERTSPDESILAEPVELPSTTIPGNNGGHPLVPEREDGAVTQGELIRMEQEAGVVPVSRAQQSTGVSMAGMEDEDDLEIDDELGEIVPHARGPNLLGTVDIGKVDGRDVQVTIGSPPLPANRGREVDVNDAQDVLSRAGAEPDSQARMGVAAAGARDDDDNDDTKDPATTAEDFEIVTRPSESDEMAIDNVPTRGEDESDRMDATTLPSEGEDEDIVLVDVDGKVEGENDDTEINSGNHAK